jgi:hypothetical protein
MDTRPCVVESQDPDVIFEESRHHFKAETLAQPTTVYVPDNDDNNEALEDVLVHTAKLEEELAILKAKEKRDDLRTQIRHLKERDSYRSQTSTRPTSSTPSLCVPQTQIPANYAHPATNATQRQIGMASTSFPSS